VQDVYTGWVEALRSLGQHVVEYNLGDRLAFYDNALLPTREDGVFRKAVAAEDATRLAVAGLSAQLYNYRPDVLLVVSGFFIPAAMLDHVRSSGTRVVLLHTESPYEEARQIALSGHADISLINDPTNLAQYPGVAVYVPHAYRPAVHCPGEAKPELLCDFSFVGTGYPTRVRFFEAMDLDGLDVTLAGNWQGLDETSPLRARIDGDTRECMDNIDTVDLYRATTVGINLYRRDGLDPHCAPGVAMGPRETEMAACGLFFLRDPRAEGDELLHMLPTFASPDEASEQLRWWLGHDRQREQAAAAAREAVSGRTFDANATALLRLLEKGIRS
jgi:hypothetical protein